MLQTFLLLESFLIPLSIRLLEAQVVSNSPATKLLFGILQLLGKDPGTPGGLEEAEGSVLGPLMSRLPSLEGERFKMIDWAPWHLSWLETGSCIWPAC